jgi:hypothetical protein
MPDISRDSSSDSGGKVHTINSVGMGRLLGKNAIVTGAAGYVYTLFVCEQHQSSSFRGGPEARFIHVMWLCLVQTDGSAEADTCPGL